MTREILKEIQNQIDVILFENDITAPQDVFKFLNDYQNTKLKGIEDANNEKKDIAIQRTLMYFDIDFITKYKRSKNKERLLFKLVNSFVLQIPNIDCVDSNGYSLYMWEEIKDKRDKILINESWYLRTIPESKWIIDYLKDMK